MKRILLLLVLCLNISMVLGQEYKNWEKYDIEGFYIIAKSKAEAKISKNVLREGADYYILTEMDDQVFPSGVSKKITPKLYKLKDTEIYIFFSFPPFLFDADNGMIEIKDNKGTFFKKPTHKHQDTPSPISSSTTFIIPKDEEGKVCYKHTPSTKEII